MNAKQLAENIGSNAWNWGLLEFCRHTGLNNDAYGQEKFQTFRKLAYLLGEFDDRLLEIIAGEKKPLDTPAASL